MKPTVLIVDDSLTVRMDLTDAFTTAGFDVHTAETVEAARRRVVESRPHLVVLDVVLPDADGLELLAEMKGAPSTASIPIVLLSTEAEVKDRIRGLVTGADEYVGKPYDPDLLVARGRNLVRVRGAAGEAPLVLVVDDSLTVREDMRELLTAAGYRTAVASTGEEALRRASAIRPDAIVIDGHLPGIDGSAVIRRLRQDPALQSMPCLMLTGTEGATSEIGALDAGADDYVLKSEHAEVVLAKLAALLRASIEPGAGTIAAPFSAPRRVLAVDDSETYLNALADHLRLEGHEPILARSGEEALELLAAQSVDCILMDLHMPRMDGIEACRRIKATPALQRVPLIMLTGRDDRASMIAGINAGADDYIAKTADDDVLKARLRAHLRRKQFEDENRRIREELLRRESETRAAKELAETKAALLAQLEEKNRLLARHADELQMLNRELETFAYSVSHDLRQPLRAITGFSGLLLERYRTDLDERGRHYLERVDAGARRMTHLVDGILLLSRVGRQDIRRVTLRLDEVAARVVDRLREADPRPVEVVIEPDLRASGDRNLVESILENLLGNAWKFTRHTAQPRIEVARSVEDGVTVFRVADNGAGFDMEYAKNLFGPFQRLHTADEFEGTGIGLATVQRIVHRHGGRVWATGAPNEGATIYFTLDWGER